MIIDNDKGFGYTSTSRCTVRDQTKPRLSPFPPKIILNVWMTVSSKFCNILNCMAESTVYAYTDRPYLVIPVYMPRSRGPDKVKPVNGHSNTPNFHLETIKTTRKYFLVFGVHKDESCAIQQDPMGPFHFRGSSLENWNIEFFTDRIKLTRLNANTIYIFKIVLLEPE